MRILIIGATGYIGKHLSVYLAENHRVFASTRKSNVKSDKIEYINIDLNNIGFVEQLPKDIDCVVYLAQSRHYREFPEKANDIYTINVNALFYLLEWLRKETNIKQFIYTSTANVYKQSLSPINENHELCGANFYAKSKLIAESLVQSYSSFFKTTILRLFTVYGPQQQNTLIPVLVSKVLNGESIQIYGDEGIRLSPIYIQDLCEMLNLVITTENQPTANTLNFASSENFSILEMVKTIGLLCDREPILEYCTSDKSSGWIADVSKFKNSYNWSSFTSFQAGLKQTIEYYMAHESVY